MILFLIDNSLYLANDRLVPGVSRQEAEILLALKQRNDPLNLIQLILVEGWSDVCCFSSLSLDLSQIGIFLLYLWREGFSFK